MMRFGTTVLSGVGSVLINRTNVSEKNQIYKKFQTYKVFFLAFYVTRNYQPFDCNCVCNNENPFCIILSLYSCVKDTTDKLKYC
jgi:hypothetical protein